MRTEYRDEPRPTGGVNWERIGNAVFIVTVWLVVFAAVGAVSWFGYNKLKPREAYYIHKEQGNDRNSGASWSEAKSTLAGALREAQVGDTLIVRGDFGSSSWYINADVVNLN